MVSPSRFPRGIPRRRLLRVLPALSAVVFVFLHAFAYPATRFSNDSYRYAREAYEFRGYSAREAQSDAVAAYCADSARLVHRNRLLDAMKFHGPGREAQYQHNCEAKYRNGLVPTSVKYDRIFRARPGYPLMAAPLIGALGAKAALTSVALACTMAAGFLVYVLLRALRAPPLTAVLGQVLYYVTPLAQWGGRPLSEGPMLALMVAILLSAVWLLQDRTALGGLLFCGAFTFGLAVKYSSFLIAAPLLMAAAYASLISSRHARHRGTWLLAGLATIGATVAICVSTMFGLPDMTDSLQDTFTLHWTHPEVANPWRSLMRLNLNYWWQWLQQQALAPLLFVFLVCATWGLFMRSVPVALCVVAMGMTGVATTVAHPLAAEQDRLYVQIWLIAVIGLPLSFEGLWRRAAQASPSPDTDHLSSTKSSAP